MTRNRVPSLLLGDGVRLRAASSADASFILSLRLDPTRSRYLETTSEDLTAQVAWMARVEREPDHRYYIVESENGDPIGTLRLLIRSDGHFGAHSMIIGEGAPPGVAVEVARIVYRFALSAGLPGGRFETRTQNERARRFFERIGATVILDDGRDCHFEVDEETMRQFLEPRGS